MLNEDALNRLNDSNGNPIIRKATRRQAEPIAPAMPALVQPPLSKTEKKVLRLLLKSMTEREVAEELGRSHNTVHVHTRNIYRKLGVTTRAMLFQHVSSNPDVLLDGEEEQPRSAAA